MGKIVVLHADHRAVGFPSDARRARSWKNLRNLQDVQRRLRTSWPTREKGSNAVGAWENASGSGTGSAPREGRQQHKGFVGAVAFKIRPLPSRPAYFTVSAYLPC